jgi:hypothetical protein
MNKLKKDQIVWVYFESGDISDGRVTGEKYEGQYAIDIGTHCIYRENSDVFDSFDHVRAWRLVKRLKRLQRMGQHIDDILFPEDKIDLELAHILYPEHLI